MHVEVLACDTVLPRAMFSCRKLWLLLASHELIICTHRTMFTDATPQRLRARGNARSACYSDIYIFVMYLRTLRGITSAEALLHSRA